MNLPAEYERDATQTFRDDESALRTMEKSWDKKLTEEENEFGKFIPSAEKKQQTFMKKFRKDLKALRKTQSTWVKGFEKTVAKDTKTYEKQADKIVSKEEKKLDKYRDTVRTQQATVGELEGEMDTMTEDISGLLERLLEGSGGQGRGNIPGFRPSSFDSTGEPIV